MVEEELDPVQVAQRSEGDRTESVQACHVYIYGISATFVLIRKLWRVSLPGTKISCHVRFMNYSDWPITYIQA